MNFFSELVIKNLKMIVNEILALTCDDWTSHDSEISVVKCFLFASVSFLRVNNSEICFDEVMGSARNSLRTLIADDGHLFLLMTCKRDKKFFI